MAAPIKIKDYVQDIRKPVQPRYGGGLLFTGDANADTITVRLYDGAAEYPVSGSVACVCIRSDGVSVPAEGTTSGNAVSATLTEACCAVAGPLTVELKVTADGVTSTVLKVTYDVYMGQTNVVADSGTIINDVAQLINAIDTARQSVPTDYTNLLHTVAGDFSATANYSVDECVWYNSVLYRFVRNHQAGSWTSADVMPVVVGNDIVRLKKTLYPYNARDVLADVLIRRNETKNNVTFAWNGDVCTVSTTEAGASAITVNVLVNLTPPAIPADIIPGETYRIKYNTTNPAVLLRVMFFAADGTTRLDTKYITKDADMRIPAGAAMWTYGLYITNGTVITTPATVSDIRLISAKTNAELNGDIVNSATSLGNYNTVNYLDQYGRRDSETKNGVTFAWSGDTCTVSTVNTGATAITINYLLFPPVKLTDVGLMAGDAVDVAYSTTDNAVKLSIRFSDSEDGSNSTTYYFSRNDTLIIPDKTYMWACLYVASGTILTEDAIVSNPAVFNHKRYESPRLAENSAIYAARFDGDAVTGLLNVLNKVDVWRKNAYLDLNNGLAVDTTASASCSEKLISIPRGMDMHVHGANRIAKYGTDGGFLGCIQATALDTIVSYEDAAFVRLQYLSTDDSTLNFNCVYWYTAHDNAASFAYKLSEAEEAVNQTGVTTATKTGNPLVLDNCDSRRAFEAFSASGVAEGEKIVVCKKNMFALRHTNGTFTKNNVKLTFNTFLNTIRFRTEGAQTALAAINSGLTDFGEEFSKVNGITLYHNFKFRFPTDTQVSVSDNPSVLTPFDYKIQMRVSDGTNTYKVGPGGLTFIALANTEYVAYFVVQAGWSGDITYSPQIEIGPYPTAYEVFTGTKTDLLTTGTENAFTCGGTGSGRYTTLNGKIVSLFDCADNSIYLDVHNDTDSIKLIYDTSKDGLVNGVSMYYIFKFTPGAVPVYVRAYDDTFAGKITAQVVDGTTIKSDYIGNGIFFYGEENKEYAFRIVIRENTEFNGVIKPVISTGFYALREFGTYAKTTVMYTDGEASLTVRARPISTRQKADKNLKTCNALETLTGGHIFTPFSKLLGYGPMVTFIDDDATNLVFVEKFHDTLATATENGVVGCYAAITSHFDEDPTIVTRLLEYEVEGFSVIYHCHSQRTAQESGRYWVYGDPEYDEDKRKNNFVTGLRRMRDAGFLTYNKYWVTPFGVNDPDAVKMAMDHGMECLVTGPMAYNGQEMYITPYGNVSRWNIPRVIFQSNSYGTTSNDDFLHRVIDNCVLANGWVIVMTHVNGWSSGSDSAETMEARLKALVNYCIDAGMDVVSFPVGFERYRAAFMMQELF